MAKKESKYIFSKVVAEADVIFKSDASQVKMPKYQPKRLTTNSPVVKKVFSSNR